SKDSVYWKKMQQYLTKKEQKEKDAELILIECTENGICPNFPFQIKYSNNNNDLEQINENDNNLNENIEENNNISYPKKRIDSFWIYSLDISNNLDYSHI